MIADLVSSSLSLSLSSSPPQSVFVARRDPALQVQDPALLLVLPHGGVLRVHALLWARRRGRLAHPSEWELSEREVRAREHVGYICIINVAKFSTAVFIKVEGELFIFLLGLMK